MLLLDRSWAAGEDHSGVVQVRGDVDKWRGYSHSTNTS